MAEQWEMCEIKLKPGSLMTVFQAVALGAQGTRVLYESRPFFGFGRNRRREGAVQEMVGQLVAEGWEPLGGGVRFPWWGYRLRRRVPVSGRHVRRGRVQTTARQ